MSANRAMIKAAKRSPAGLGYELAEGDSLKAMTPTEIKLMNAEFEIAVSNTERAICLGVCEQRRRRREERV